jgi:hypothetical protein
MSYLTLTIVKPAKSTGGDKYEILGLADDGKERFIYVPQHLSRKNDGCPHEHLNLTFVKADGLAFDLVKKGKTGDDRYAPVDEDLWKGDIYLPQIYRSDKLMFTICGSSPMPALAPVPALAPEPEINECDEINEYEFLTDTEFFKVIYIVLIACSMVYFHYEGDFTIALNTLSQYAVRV